MKGRTLLVLALLGLVLAGAAAWLAADRKPAGTESLQRDLLLPGLGSQLNAIDRVRIASAAGEAVLERGDDGWHMADRGGWPADTGKLRELLLALSEARTLEPKTANPELHAKLGVEDVGEGNGTGALVELSAGESRHALIVGNASASGSYARLAVVPQSWLLDRQVSVSKDPKDWLERELTQIDAQRVASVHVAHAEGQPVDIAARDPGPGFDITNLPKGREPASDYVAEATAGFLSALRLDDVARADDAPFADDAALSHARFTLRDGIVVALDYLKDEAGVKARFDVSLDEAAAEAFAAAEQGRAAMEWERTHPASAAAADAGEADAEADGGDDAEDGGSDAPAADDAGADEADDAEADEADEADEKAPLAVTDPEADRAARLAAIRAEAGQLEQRLEGWIFTLPSYKAEHLTKPLSGYLAPEGD